MLRLTVSRNRPWITWGSEDMRIMARVLGPEETRHGKTAPNPSVLKAADAHGALLSKELRQHLIEAETLRRHLVEVRKQEDTNNIIGYHDSVTNRLRGHQRVALQYMEGQPGFLLADQPGVGKTPVAIPWAERRASNRILVITPNSAKYQWADEIERWASPQSFRPGLRSISVIEGTKAEQNRIATNDGWVVGHWESLAHAWDGILDRPWDAVILDEAHAIRNRETQRSQSAYALTLLSDNRLCLTGHPYVKNPDEFWSILHFLYPDVYTSYWRFFSQHVEAIPLPFGGMEIIGTRSPKLLRWETSPFVLRRTKKRVFRGIATVNRIVRHIDLPKRYEATHKRLRKEFFAEIEGREKKLPILNQLSRTTRIRQFLVDPGLLDSSLPSLKYPIVNELIDELDGPPVIFTSFRQAADRLAEYLRKKGKRVEMIHGKANKGKKRRLVQKRFLAGKYDAVIIVTQAGGTALNYGRFGYVIFMDLPWSAMELEQAEGRVDRPDAETGDLVPTTAYRIVIRGSYEQRLEKRIEEKHGKFEEVFTIGRSQLHKLF